MKKFISTLILLSLLVPLAGAAESQWATDLTKAIAQAKAENKTVLADFTGSDWCTFCIKLHKDVFETRPFADYAKKNLVLVEIDFPNKKAQSDAVKRTNQQLQEKYKVEGFPTVILFNGEGKEIGRETGSDGEGQKSYLARIDKLRNAAKK
jgi:protein disulfide-isomerase